jgi:hypothetical protein
MKTVSKPGRKVIPKPGEYYQDWDELNWDWSCQITKVSPKRKIVTYKTVTCDNPKYIGVISKESLAFFQGWAQRKSKKHIEWIKGKLV